jgi:hypothetical protein
MPVIFSYEFELHGIAMVATSRGGLIDITIGQLLPSAIGRGEDAPLFDVIEVSGRERLNAGQEWIKVYVDSWCSSDRASVERVRAYLRRFDLVTDGN